VTIAFYLTQESLHRATGAVNTILLTTAKIFAKVVFMKKYTEGEILKILRETFIPARGTTQTQIAARLGFSVQYIQAVLAGSRPLTDAMLDALGFERRPIYFRKGKP